ncbi:hypothetical protein [Thermogutta sp.]|uniref:hypothetical protein n=1 Tax=Thermogutta sp. TaxID=1962930 RepID=UPI003C7ADA38
MDLYTPSADSGLFNLLGKLFALGRAVDATRTGNVWTKRQALEAVLDLAPQLQTAIISHDAWDAAGAALHNQIVAAAQSLIRRYIEEKNFTYRTLNQALEVIRSDLVAGGYYFTASTKSLTVTPGAANQGDALIAVSDRNGYGEPVWIYPETINLKSDGTRLTVSGARASTLGRGDRNWPQGSGAYFTIPLASLNQSLLANPGLETTSAANTPDAWTIHTGTPGTTIVITEPEQQQIAITGNPTGGYFVLTWTDPLGKVWHTTPLGPAPTTSDIQAALRGIPGLAAVTVSGTNPFTVIFEDTPGDIAHLQVINRLTGGTNPQVTVTTTRAGDVLSYRGRSLKLVGNGSEQTTLYQPVRLSPGRVYLFFARARRSSSATGTVNFELRRSISDTALADSAGNVKVFGFIVSDPFRTGIFLPSFPVRQAG